MEEIKTLPGYLTLAEAENRYKIKADTLKKKCQKGEIIGAKKAGKTWFLPNIPGIDPERTIPENYPSLNFKAALSSNISLYDAESEARYYLYNKHKTPIYIWEYGYYFLSLIFGQTKVHSSYAVLASMVTEAHSALRCSFLINLYGYHPDAMALLRKVHETTIKVLAMKTESKKIWKIGFSKSRQVSEHKIGVDFSSQWRLESSYSHGNLIKLFEIGKLIQENKENLAVPYGPQLDYKQFRATINLSIFWLYILTKSLTYLFPGQISNQWLAQKEDSAKLLRDYLDECKVSQTELQVFDNAIMRLEKKFSTNSYTS